MPDLDLVTADGPLRVFELLHDAKPVLLNLGQPGGFDITPWADRVQLIDASYKGEWELPVLGVVTAPTAVLIRPDGYVAWVGDGTDVGFTDALATWFGPPTAAQHIAAVHPRGHQAAPPSTLAPAQMRVVDQRTATHPLIEGLGWLAARRGNGQRRRPRQSDRCARAP